MSLGFTTAALAATRALGLDSLAPELVAVTLANLAAAAFRFTILRTWVFRPRFGTHHGCRRWAGPTDRRTRPTRPPSTPVAHDRIPTRTAR